MMITVYPARRHALLALLLTIGLTACAEAPKPPPDEAYRQAVEEAKEGHNQEAKRLFEQVRDADTPVRLEFLAEIGIADSLYKDRKYEEAAAEYSHLFDIHSGDAIADYLKYQLGMCYYRRIDTIDRDQGLTRKARSEFTELVTRYPESDLVPAAQENLRLCNEYLAKRELYVGNFYFAKGNFRAAKNRYERGITDYGRVDSLPQLLHRLVLAEDALGETDAAQQTAARLATEYPDDRWNQNLHAALEEQRQRLAAEAGDGLLNRMRHWWSEEETANPAEPAEPEPAGAAPAAAEPEAAPVKDTHTASPGPQSGGSPDPDLRSPVTDAAHDAGVATVDQSSRWQRLIEWLHGGAVAEAETLDTPRPAVAPVAASAAAAAESEPWPGSTVATVAAAPPAAAAPDSSRWQRFVTWLHGPAAAPTASPPPVAAPTTTTPGLIVRHIPPVADEPTERLSVTPHAQPDRRVAASPAPVAPPPVATVPPPVPAPLSEAAAETAPAAVHAAAPRYEEMPPPVATVAPSPAPVPEPVAETAPATIYAAATPPEEVRSSAVVTQAPAPVPEPSAVTAPATSSAAASPAEVRPPAVTVAQASAAPASSTRPVMTDVPATGHGGLMVEEFPATDDGEETGLPAVQDAPATPTIPTAAAPPAAPAAEATSPRPPLAERVDEAIAAAEGGSPPPSPAAVTARPVPRTTEVEPAAVSGQGTRNQPPRPLPLPAYARPTPPASGEAGLVPAAIAGRQTTAAPAVEWRSLTPAERPAPVGEPIGDVALPAIAPQAEAPAEPPAAPDFWQGLRDTYGRLAESEP